MLIRQANFDADHADVRALWHDYLSWVNPELEAQYGISFPIEEILEKNLADLSPFAPPRGRLLLASDTDGAAGIACLQPISAEVGEVKRMYVRPRARGTGLGRRLLAGLLDAAREAGYRGVRLDSARFMDAAHALYRSAGFRDIEPYEESEVPPEFWRYWVFMELHLEQGAGGRDLRGTP
jgi:GNAT superfamily N-acetyltransferase